MLSAAQVKAIRQKNHQPSIEVTQMFGALGDATRWHLFRLLLENKDLCVTDLARIVGVSVPAASQHLRVLEVCGLVDKDRMGQSMCYKVKKDNPMAKTFIRFVSTLQK